MSWRVEYLQVFAEIEEETSGYDNEWAEFMRDVHDYSVLVLILNELTRKRTFKRLVRQAKQVFSARL